MKGVPEINWSDDTTLLICLGVGILGINLICWLIVFTLRSSSRNGSVVEAMARTIRGSLAEAIGVFALLFVGLLVCVAHQIVKGTAPGLLAVALAHGVTITVLASALGSVSGAHFNPAVTFGLLLAGRISLGQAIAWISGQMLGAVAAAGLLTWLFGSATLVAGIPTPAADLPPRAAFVLEAVATFFLVLVVFGTAVDPRGPGHLAPFAIGLTVTIGILAIGPLTGGALNPARFFAPALMCEHFTSWPVYLAGPCVGGAVAATLMQFFLMTEEPAEEAPVVGLVAEQERRQAA